MAKITKTIETGVGVTTTVIYTASSFRQARKRFENYKTVDKQEEGYEDITADSYKYVSGMNVVTITLHMK